MSEIELIVFSFFYRKNKKNGITLISSHIHNNLQSVVAFINATNMTADEMCVFEAS